MRQVEQREKSRQLLQNCRSAIERSLYFCEEEELQKKPEDGGWNALQCIEHVNLVNEAYIKRLKKSMTLKSSSMDETPFRHGWFGSLFLKQMQPRSRAKRSFSFKAPKAVQPPSARRGQAVFQDFQVIFDEIETLLEQSQYADLNQRIQTFVPFVKLRLGVILELLPTHALRHIEQAERALQN